ncbi:hypothetical protein [Emcibacter sp.]|uniref:hypothetical protein n=1 Tax=Emcibacter sp. TaxID=1979954 RepID=UPI002AA84F90|nr:hypothetical protein [Emcibacter sp.]
MSRKELPIRFKAYPHANDNGSVSGSPPDPRLLNLARLIAHAAVRDLIDGLTANDNVDNLTVAGRHPLKGTEQVSAAEPVQDELPLKAHSNNTGAKSTRAQAPHLPADKSEAHTSDDLPAGTQLYLFPDDIETPHDK